MSEEIEEEFRALRARNLALSLIIENVLSRLARNPSLRPAIIEGFAQALDVARSAAVEYGTSTPSDQAVMALEIVEEARAMVLALPG
jgi:hypothetical protein